MKFRWMLSRGRVLAGVLCQIRARQASKQSQDWFEVASHSVPAIHRDFMEDGKYKISKLQSIFVENKKATPKGVTV